MAINEKMLAKILMMKGETGATGNGITNVSVTESTESGGNNIITISFSDGTSKSFKIKNGKDLSDAQTTEIQTWIKENIEILSDSQTIEITDATKTQYTFNFKIDSSTDIYWNGLLLAAGDDYTVSETDSKTITLNSLNVVSNGDKLFAVRSYSHSTAIKDTTYTLTKSGDTITLTGSDGSVNQVEVATSGGGSVAKHTQNIPVTDATAKNYTFDFNVDSSVDVYYNGLLLASGTDYTVSTSDAKTITLSSDSVLTVGDTITAVRIYSA